jgi:hypothetical protein
VAGLPKFSDHKLLDTLSSLNDKRISSTMSTTMSPQRAAELVSGGDAGFNRPISVYHFPR